MLDDSGDIIIEKLNFEVEPEQKMKKYDLIDLIRNKYQRIKTPIPYEDLVVLWEEHGGNRTELDKLIEKLKRSGDMFEPKVGHYTPL